MKRIIPIILVIIIIIALFSLLNRTTTTDGTQPLATSTNQTGNTQQQNVPVTVIPLSHATGVLTWANKNIFLDPTGGAANFQGIQPPNIILVTDIHGDHLSTSTLNTIVGSSTLIAPKAVVDLLPANLKSRAVVMNNGQTRTEQGFTITAVPMYNYPEATDSRHTKGRGNGYIIERDGYRVYVAGDTGPTPEMKALTDIDMAFVPMNLPFTMGVEDAAQAVLAFKPKIVYPYHYRGQDGLADVAKFKTLVNTGDSNIEVVLANWYPQQ
ncbi:MAG: MBL fold metallo-hydrolase [Patescibacteria group bacterium]